MQKLKSAKTSVLVHGAGTNSTMGVWYGGLHGCATMNWALCSMKSEILLGTVQCKDKHKNE